MSCSNNNNNCGCGCENTSTNPCGCKISSNEVVYVGPPLGCTGISNCDTITEALQAIDSFICGPGMVETIIYNITNNTALYAEFITIVNNSVDCETVWGCITSSTTTTIFPCESFSLDNLSTDIEAIIITNCVTGLQEAVILLPGITDICVETNSPLTVPGTVIATPTGPCNTTTTTSSSTTSTTTTLFIPCECLTIHNTDSVGQYFSYTDCNNVISDFIPISAEEIVNVCGCCVSATNPLVTISIGENCVDGICPIVLNDCAILVNAVNGDIIGYDIETNQSEVLTNLIYSNDIANTTTKMWLYDNITNIIKEYDITINPWTISFDKDISFPVGVVFGAGLGAISNTKLITTNTLISPQPIIEVTIIGTTAIVSDTIAALDAGYQISGDILLTVTDKVICLANTGSIYKLFQYDRLTGLKEVEVNISTSIGIEYPLGLAENNNKLYILCSAGSVYEVDLNSPYSLTLANVGDFTVSGASQAPECNSVNLIIPSTNCTMWDWASTGDNTSALDYTDCYNVFTSIPYSHIINNSGSICVYPNTTPVWNPTPTTGSHTLETSGVVCTTTTTTSSTSSTTTTTTTIVYPYPCTCIHVTISQTDIDDATGNTPAPGKADNTVYLTTSKFAGCDGSEIAAEYTVVGVDGFCIKTSEISNIALYYYKNNVPVYFPATASTYNILYASCSVNGECIPA